MLFVGLVRKVNGEYFVMAKVMFISHFGDRVFVFVS